MERETCSQLIDRRRIQSSVKNSQVADLVGVIFGEDGSGFAGVWPLQVDFLANCVVPLP